MLKKIIYGIVNFISVVIIAAAIVVLIMVLLTKPGKPPSIGGFTLLRITTGSMVPTYDVDTMILVQETDPSQIREGDVISFYSSDPMLDGAVNTHRVVRIEKDGGQYVYTTKGDGNNVEDPYDVKSEYLVGKVIWSSVILGKISRLVSNPLIFIPVILVPLAVILLSNFFQTISLARKIAKEEEEAAIREAVEQFRKKKELEKFLRLRLRISKESRMLFRSNSEML